MRGLVCLALFFLAVPAWATVTIDWVTVGDPGNACWPGLATDCRGEVDYGYDISKYEITNTQYAEFLNAVAATDPNGLWISSMGSVPGFGGISRNGSPGTFTYAVLPGKSDKPAIYLSFYNALRFANWLNNSQPTGAQDSLTTEDGAYTFTGITNVGARNAGATIFLPSLDEWFKAAYYDPLSGGFFEYPASSDVQTTCMMPGPSANTANCEHAAGDPFIGELTVVGSYTLSPSPNGTFDQGGNVNEWNEEIYPRYSPGCGSSDLCRGIRES